MASEELDQNINLVYVEENPDYKILMATETYKRLCNLQLDNRIKVNAIYELNRIQSNLNTRMFKKSKQDEVIFVALYKAYINCNIPVEPNYILELIDSKVLSLDKVLSKYEVNEINPLNLVTYYIDRYLELALEIHANVNRDSLLQNAMTLVSTIIDDEENVEIYNWVCSRSTKNVVLAILSSFLEEQLKGFNLKLWCQAAKITVSSVNKYKRCFEEVLSKTN